MYGAFLNAVALCNQGQEVPAAAAAGVFVLDSVVVVPDTAAPQEQPMKVCRLCVWVFRVQLGVGPTPNHVGLTNTGSNPVKSSL
jgi:hypothetical protein